MFERTLEEGSGRRERIDIAETVRRSVAQARRDHPKVELETDLPEEATVVANDLIGSAVEKLLQNAIEHNDSDRPIVEVSIEKLASDGVVEVVVEDNGPGIPAVEREVLARGSESSLHHSSGLGLRLVHWIVTESNGEITFEDLDPRGTAITVSLPAAEEPPTED